MHHADARRGGGIGCVFPGPPQLRKESRAGIARFIERFLSAIGIAVRSDLDGIKRRVGAIERQVEQLVEGTMRKRARNDESAAA